MTERDKINDARHREAEPLHAEITRLRDLCAKALASIQELTIERDLLAEALNSHMNDAQKVVELGALNLDLLRKLNTATGEVNARDAEIAKLRASHARLVEGLKDIFALLDEEQLVRNTQRDSDEGWALQAMKFTARLQSAQQALVGAKEVA